eukprot:scaffold4595_cov267-Chaetoceros_neogracile.AAC.21
MHGNLNGRNRSAASSVDFYRRVPKDLTEATSLGAIMSLCAMLLMAILFSAETFAFARSKISTEIALDDNTDPQIQLNFNITLFALQCDYVSVDVWDVLGTNKQNVTKNVEKWQVDELGFRRSFSGRNRETRELQYEKHEETLEELHANGIHVTEIESKEHFDLFLEEHEMAFVNFFAPWCMWCQRLHPTWEKFAEEVEEKEMPVGVANIDCVKHIDVCRAQQIQAFPALRWYEGGKFQQPQYKSDRTLSALVSFASRKLELNDKFKNWSSNMSGKTTQEYRELYSVPENPGCQVSGSLMVNRVPGNFHVEAKSKNHNLNAAMTNLTHRVNHLSFGEMGKNPSRQVKRALKQVPESLQQFTPLDDKVFLTKKFHQAYHHYIKVVSTHLNIGSSSGSMPTLYQFLEQSQVVGYDEVNVPEARFSYDLSPMSVVVEKNGRKWYDYLTSLSAIIGGTFTTLGLIDAVLFKVFKPKKL